MPTRSTPFAAIVALAIVAIGSPAAADTMSPPYSYRIVAPGGQYVFVMMGLSRAEEGYGLSPAAAADAREIHRTYTRSGMYRNDGSTDPLWTVDGYIDRHRVEVASDGIHLIRRGFWPQHPDQEAISFFANSTLLQSYTVRELVNDPDKIIRSVSGRMWWEGAGRFDNALMEYTQETGDGNRFVFDVRTGKIVSEFRAAQLTPVGWWAAAAAVAAGVAAWLVWRRGGLTPARRRQSRP